MMNSKILKKVMLWSSLFVAAAALIAYLLLVAFSTLDTLDLRFASYEEAVKGGVMERDLVPSFLPLSAKEIEVNANLDGGGVFVKFTFGSDFDSFLNAQKKSPGVTPEQLGLNDHDRTFSKTSEVVLIDKIFSGDDYITGYMLVNLKKRRALYVK